MNKITNFEEDLKKYDYQSAVGYQSGINRGLIALGLFKDQADIDNSPRQDFGNYLPGDIKYKDVNGDGILDETDAKMVEQYYTDKEAGLNPVFSEDAEENARIFQLADVNGDGKVNLEDVTTLCDSYLSPRKGDATYSGTEIIDNFTVVRGDVDGNGKVDVEDAISVLTYYARKSAGLSSGVSSENDFLKRANMNKDKKIAIEDAVLILNYYAMQSSGQSVLPDVIDFKEGELNSDPQVPIYR